MSPSGDVRYEQKIVVRASALAWVESRLRVHPAGFHQLYPPRRVNNVYFDSPDCHAYAEALSGLARRVKMRLRWYGTQWRIARGVFELKFRQGGVGWKKSQELSGVYDLSSDLWPNLLERLRREKADGVADRLRIVYWPVLINHYMRQYYISCDGAVRVTIDTDQRTYDQIATSRPNISFASVQRDFVVIEFKALAVERSRLADVMAAFPLRSQKNSKYALGVAAGVYRP